MSRPKKGTEKGDIATEKWRATMEEKYGGPEKLHEKMREMGRKGGSKGAADGAVKGFAAMIPEKRRAAGAKGGKISRRGPAGAKSVAKPVVKATKKATKNVEDDFVAPKPTAKEAKQIRENFFRRMFRRNK